MLFPLLFAALAQPDADLAQRLKKHEHQAMADLYDRYGRFAYTLILRVVKDEGIAEDLTQETFLRVWNRAHFFDAEKGSLAAWILTVARNRAIDYLRSQQGRGRETMVDLDSTEHPALFVTIDANILNSDRARRLRQAFTTLSDQQKQVIELAYFEGLTQTEMAERMEQPLGTIKTWCRTALLRLRQELGEAVAP